MSLMVESSTPCSAAILASPMQKLCPDTPALLAPASSSTALTSLTGVALLVAFHLRIRRVGLEHPSYSPSKLLLLTASWSRNSASSASHHVAVVTVLVTPDSSPSGCPSTPDPVLACYPNEVQASPSLPGHAVLPPDKLLWLRTPTPPPLMSLQMNTSLALTKGGGSSSLSGRTPGTWSMLPCRTSVLTLRPLHWHLLCHLQQGTCHL